MSAPRVVVIGAGSASFGLNTLGAFLASERLGGWHLALVDRNPETLGWVKRLADRMNAEWEAGLSISAHTHHDDALEGARFVVSAIEVPPREALWRQDYEIPLVFGVRQPYAENGGPGGFAHAARNIPPLMDIAHAMERYCPNAWLINYTNPMTRICDAVNRYSNIKVVGLCHQINMGYALVGKALAGDYDIHVPDAFTNSAASPTVIPARRAVVEQAQKRFEIIAAGTNHFTWIIDIRDKQSGNDLYPLFRQRWNELPEAFEPLTRRVFDAFGYFPVAGDEHLCEYLPWVSDPQTKPWEKFELDLYEWDLWDELRGDGHADIQAMGAGEKSTTALKDARSEGALEVIEHICGAGHHFHQAFNLPNQGYISNLPENSIVEVPGLVSGAGIHGLGVGALPRGIAELCRRELTVGQLGVDAAVQGDRQLALQCLLLDPVITDMDVARLILDKYLEDYRDFLPQFWH